jgi:uncharacterized membrane protein
MACFSLAWIEQLLIWLVVVILCVAIVKMVLPWLLSLFGTPPGGGMVLIIIQYVIWALVTIAVIIFIFDMLDCVFNGTHLALHR